MPIRGRTSRAVAGVTVAAALWLSPAATAGAIAGPAAGRAAAFTPSGGTPVATASQAGYVASGRDFRYAQALITVPDGPCTPASPQIYVALDDSTPTNPDFARAGIGCPVVTGPAGGPAFGPVNQCAPVIGPADRPGFTPSGLWAGFVSVATPAAPTPVIHTLVLPNVSPGDGVLVSVYLDPSGTSVHTTITLPNGTTCSDSLAVDGPVYTSAQALADWSGATPATPVPPPAKIRLSQFHQGAFTTLSGQHGTFSGPWAVNAWEVTSNGSLPPSGTLIGQPSYLWADGAGPGGRWGDAFGIWEYPF